MSKVIQMYEAGDAVPRRRGSKRCVVILGWSFGLVMATACIDDPTGDGESTETDGSSSGETGTQTGGDKPKFESEDPQGENDESDNDSGDDPNGEDNEDGDDDGGDDDAGDEDKEEEDDDGDSDDPELVISEADMIQIEGDRLYALSEYRGLTVIDIANPTKLKVLGEYTMEAVPFEMYVEAGQAFVMVRDFWSWWDDSHDDDEGWSGTSSRLLSLDATDPAKIQLSSDWEIPGRIEDSRRIGDTLYLMSYEDGYCWKCNDERKVAMNSFDISNLRDIQHIASLDLELGEYAWRAPSIMTTTERIYLAVPDEREEEGLISRLELVDIMGADGQMRRADTIAIEGFVRSRWQMSEYDDVLRVVTQPDWSLESPIVETFDVADPNETSRLGRLEMTLPRPEELQSVRFDGQRGYAITFERTDPLFTLDLSNPAEPKQVGELEIPGWVYHMEPRGDRLLGVGFEPENPAAGLHVSLFDVSDMAKPTMLSRANFGGDWGSFGEDQNRIHKAFKIWDDEQLITVPFYGWSWNDEGDADECEHGGQSAVQLIDWKDDTLTARGVAQTLGRARRSFLHRDSLFTVSDESVRSYDIRDRDAPAALGEAMTSMRVDQLLDSDGPHRIRIRRDWWSERVRVEVAARDAVTSPEAIGVLELDDALDVGCNGWAYLQDATVVDQRVYLQVDGTRWVKSSEDPEKEKYIGFSRLVSVDFSDPANPKSLGQVEFDTDRYRYWRGDALGPMWLDHASIEFIGHTALVVERQRPGDKDDDLYRSSIRVFDLSGQTPVERPAIERPITKYSGGLFRVSPTQLASWYATPDDAQPGTVYFYLERFHLTPAGVQVQTINVPGVPVAVNASTNTALTTTFHHQVDTSLSRDECYAHGNYYRWDWRKDVCRLVDIKLNALTLNNGEAELVTVSSLGGDNRNFRRVLSRGSRAYVEYVRHYVDDEAVAVDRAGVTVLDIGAEASTQQINIPHEGEGYWWGTQVLGEYQILRLRRDGELELIDSENLSDLKRSRYRTSRFSWCQDPIVDGNDLLCAAEHYGVNRYVKVVGE